jgi:hypothetical protein
VVEELQAMEVSPDNEETDNKNLSPARAVPESLLWRLLTTYALYST